MSITTQPRKTIVKQDINMEQKTLNLDNVKTLAAKASAEKSKLLIAIALITVMAFMWIKVFSGKSTVTNAAAGTAHIAQKAAVQRTITYVELPVVAGRNDMLKRNVFDCSTFGPSAVAGGGGMGRHRTNIEKIAKTIKLGAVITGENPAAFIDSQLVSVGSVLPLKCDGQLYEFAVTEITETTALLSWKDFNITVRMAQPQSDEQSQGW